MLLGTVGDSLLGNVLTGKGVNKKDNQINRAGEDVIRAVYCRPLPSASQNQENF